MKPLIAALKDPDPEVRHLAAVALVEIPDVRTVELLIAALRDKSAQARAWAALALGRIKNPLAIDPLVTVLNDANEEVRQRAVIALGEFGDGRGIQPLIGKLKDDSPVVRMSAAEALGNIKDPRVEPLIAALEDKSVQVRLKASQALVDMTDELNEAKEEHPVTDPIDSMTPEELAQGGEVLIFGGVGGMEARRVDGKGQCALCHTFKEDDIGDRAPNLLGVTKRAAERIKEPRYLHPDTVQTEAFPGSGRATTAMEYLAESNVCPSCYVVQGFGIKGTNDRESPYARINKPPINLSINEMIMVNAWLYHHDGETPPPVAVMRAAFEKFIPEKERVYQAERPTGFTS